MSDIEPFEPVPFLPVSDPQQIKAFAEPTRVRLLHLLADRAATNQQLAAALEQPQARVLHHVRFLLDAGLIKLVEQRIRGGNVEKYYRATARLYGFRPDPAVIETVSGPVSGAIFESVTQELVASLKLWPGQPLTWETRRARMSDERLAEFNHKLLALLAAYWGDPSQPAPDEIDGELMAYAGVSYRFPGGE